MGFTPEANFFFFALKLEQTVFILWQQSLWSGGRVIKALELFQKITVFVGSIQVTDFDKSYIYESF